MCFFLVVFFSRYDIDIWLATVSLAELMKSPEASDWSPRASDWSNKITFSNSNMGLCAKERRGKNLVLKHVQARNVTGSKVFQVWSFEFPYRVFWTRINPGLVPFYRDTRYLDRSSQFSHPTQHFPAQSRARNLCQVLTGGAEDPRRVEIISLTQKYCHSYNNAILRT